MGTSSRGFASMSPEKQKEIASKGGKAAHQKGTAHQFTSEEARAAGRKGGQASGQARATKKAKNTVSNTSNTGTSAAGHASSSSEMNPGMNGTIEESTND
jgi:general stress protein YciG